ncbi:MAG: hypothetical protein HP496_12915 [Nitrospira sp.]|nr:hypothetical protein [Nitrospira sp.]
MHSTKYIIVQDGNGWRGYLEGYPEQEAYGESFEELQIKLWQLHQCLIDQESEQGRYENGERDRHHGHTSTLPRHTPTASRPMSRAQIKRRALVEQLLFAIISNR